MVAKCFCVLWLLGIRFVGIKLVCMKSFLEPLEESKAPLPKEHFLHLLSPLCASKLIICLNKNSPVEICVITIITIIAQKAIIGVFLVTRTWMPNQRSSQWDFLSSTQGNIFNFLDADLQTVVDWLLCYPDDEVISGFFNKKKMLSSVILANQAQYNLRDFLYLNIK